MPRTCNPWLKSSCRDSWFAHVSCLCDTLAQLHIYTHINIYMYIYIYISVYIYRCTVRPHVNYKKLHSSSTEKKLQFRVWSSGTFPKSESIFFQTVPKIPISRDSPQKTKNTKTHRPRNEHIHRDSPQKNKKANDSGTSPKSEMSIFLETVPQKPKIPKPLGHEMSTFIEAVQEEPKSQRFQAIGAVLRNGLWDSSESLNFFGSFGTVSMNILISWPRGFGILVSLGLSREICSFPISRSWAAKGKSLVVLRQF